LIQINAAQDLQRSYDTVAKRPMPLPTDWLGRPRHSPQMPGPLILPGQSCAMLDAAAPKTGLDADPIEALRCE